MKRVLKRVDSRFSRYKRVSQQPIKSALQKRAKIAFGPDFAQKISTNQKHLFAFANDVENAKNRDSVLANQKLDFAFLTVYYGVPKGSKAPNPVHRYFLSVHQ